MIPRLILDAILEKIEYRDKIILLYGARQVGKTTLLKTLIEKSEIGASIWVNGDKAMYREFLSVRNLEKIKELIGTASLMIIDEAQNIPDIGINLKIIHDELPEIKVIITESSVLELANNTRESLAGRTQTYHLYPIALSELTLIKSSIELKQDLHQHLTYGLYPEVLTTEGRDNKIALLGEIVESYLFKDVLMLSNIRKSDKLTKLLKLLAYQIGSLVSVHEIAKTLGLNHETVTNYIDLLEKGFVIKRLSGYANNPRKEISKMDKIYFYDIGIRNAVINDFSDVTLRPDLGAIWENYMIMERMKYLHYNKLRSNFYFWKRYSGAELDLIEERDGQLFATDFKWKKLRTSPPKSWSDEHKNSTYKCINKDNYLDFVT